MTSSPACAATELPSITALCQSGRCEVIDLTDQDVTACTSSDDCMLHTQQCCGCGPEQELVAIAESELGTYERLVCAPSASCAENCEPVFPDGIRATCIAGHCRVDQGPLRE